MGQSVRAYGAPRRRRRSRGQPRPWISDRTAVAVPVLTLILAVLLVGSLAWSRHCMENRPVPSELVLLETVD